MDFSFTFVCASTRRCRAAKAETIWIGALDFALAPDRRTVLPSMAMTSTGVLVSAATQSTKQRWNASASSVAKMSPSVSCGGVPSAKAETDAAASVSSPRTARCLRAIRAGKHRKQRKKQHLIKGIDDLPRLPKIRQSAEIT